MVIPEGAASDPDVQITAEEYSTAPAVQKRQDAAGERPFLNRRRLNRISLVSVNDL